MRNREPNEKIVDVKDIDCMLFCEENLLYYMDDEQARFREDCGYLVEIPCKLFLANKIEIELDAEGIVENACDNLHEDAYDQCDIKSLQVLLDKWCKEQTGATSFEPNYYKYVLVKEWLDREVIYD